MMLTAEAMPVGTGARGLLLEVTSNSSVTSFTLCNLIVRFCWGWWFGKLPIPPAEKQSHSTLASNKHYYL